MSSFIQEKLDYKAHNEEVRSVMQAYCSGRPYRVPVVVSGSITNYLLNPEINVNGWSFKDFFENPEIQVRAQLEYQKWQRFNLVCDREMGLPDEGWYLAVDFQNSYDAGWMGCPLQYWDGQVPDTKEILAEDKEKFYDMPPRLDANNGLMSRIIEFWEYMVEASKTMEFEGRPVIAPASITGEKTDGPLDLAYKLRGAANLLLDMLTDEKYYHDLMTYITENFIRRSKSLKELRWAKLPDSPDKGVYRMPNFSFADDAIAMISTEHYKEFVYPYHKRIIDELSDGTGIAMHFCGDATRHFKFIKENLGTIAFDTGFPVDHGWLRKELGPDVQINGGPTIMVVKDGSPEDIEAEVKRICSSGVMEGGRFVMIAANNLAPCTPVENVRALYEATKKYGRFS